MQTYRRFVSYVYQYENGKKAGNRGFIKVEARGNTCSMQIALKGVCRDGNGKCRIFGFKREDGLLKGSLLAECPVKTGIVQEQLAFLRSSMGNAGYSLHELSGVIFQGDDETMYGTQWDDEPMKMENFQPDENNAVQQKREEPEEELVNEESMEPETEWPVQEELQEEILEDAKEQMPVVEMPNAEPRLDTLEMPTEESEPRPEVMAESPWEEKMAETARIEPEEETIVAKSPAEMSAPDPVIMPEGAREERAAMEAETPVIATESVREERAAMEAEEPVIAAKSVREERATMEAEEPVIAAKSAQEESVAMEAEEPMIAAGTVQMAPEAAVKNPSQEDMAQVEMIAKAPIERQVERTAEVVQDRPMAAGIRMETPQNERIDIHGAGIQEKKERQPELKKLEEQQIEAAKELSRERQNPEEPRPLNILPHTGAEEENFFGAEKMEEGPLEILDTTVDISDLNRDAQDNYIKPDMEAENVSEKRRFNPFTDGVLEDCQRITLDDLMRLDPRDQGLRNNRFVQHGHQMFGHLLLAKVARNSQYILGVPGIYQQQEKFMADMFGFHNFKCARRRGAKTPCFGYWYRLIYPPKLCMRNKCPD